MFSRLASRFSFSFSFAFVGWFLVAVLLQGCGASDSGALKASDGGSLADGAVYPEGSPQVELVSLRTYEKGNKWLAPDDRTYTAEFQRSETRHINWELVLKNRKHGVKGYSYEVSHKYYGPDGALIHEDGSNWYISKGTETTDFVFGEGAVNPGSWQAGAYRLEIWIEGTKFTETAFTVIDDREKFLVDDAVHPVDSPTLEFDFLNVYNENPTNSWEPGIAAESFPTSKTYSIFVELQVINLSSSSEETRYPISIKYYNPDGSLHNTLENTFYVAPGEEPSKYVDGLSYGAPGEWQPGVHRVEIWIDGRKWAERSFTITED